MAFVSAVETQVVVPAWLMSEMAGLVQSPSAPGFPDNSHSRTGMADPGQTFERRLTLDLDCLGIPPFDPGAQALSWRPKGDRVDRREAILAFVMLGAACAAPASFAQKLGKVWHVGVLLPIGRPTSLSPEAAALLRGLQALGYVEGKNLQIEWRYADGKYDRFAGLAAELVQLKMDVIVTGGPAATGAAQRVTTTVPIVMANSDDPVASGFVKSLARPGGNITGLSNISGEIGPKQLEVLLGMVPGLSRVAVLVNPTNASSIAMVLRPLHSAAQAKGIVMLSVQARTPQEIDTAFTRIVNEKAKAVIVVQDALFSQHRSQLADLAAKHRLPTIGRDRSYAGAGGLMSYGPNGLENFRRVATYVDKILKGANPGDLPVEQPTTFDLLINSKTAKTLGLAIPELILLRAHEVIE